MGLDNSFIFKSQKDSDNEIEIVYWRKCWGYRDVVKSAELLFSETYGEVDYDPYYFKITVKHLDYICKELEKFLDKEYWENNSRTIWDFNPVALQKDINVLKRARMLLSLKPDLFSLHFCDSY